MRDVYIAAVGMIPFGKHFDLGPKQLTARALDALFEGSEFSRKDVQAAWFSNSGWGGPPYNQTCIRGQIALAAYGMGGFPITNVENACASGSTAINAAYLAIGAGAFDVVLAVGAEKLAVPKDAGKEAKKAAMEGFIGGTDVEVARSFIAALKADAARKRAEAGSSDEASKDRDRTPFMDLYSMGARDHMKRFGTTQRQLAVIAAKNHTNGAKNPYSQYQFEMTPEQVLADYEVSYPLTRSMCSPMGDGAAAAILVSGDWIRRHGRSGAVKLRASVLGSADLSVSGPDRAVALAQQAYEAGGLGPEDIDFAEVHDATAFGELANYENLGFCARGEGGPFAESGATAIGGKVPVNPSGGLESRGHPVGATGIAMVAECFWQLRGEAGGRQVDGARIGLIENGGGFLGTGEAAMVINILERA